MIPTERILIPTVNGHLDPVAFRAFLVEVLGYHSQSGIPLLSDSAVNLMLGTAAVETDLGAFRRQLGGGPALGIFQMEPNTFNWLRGQYQDQFPRLLVGASVQLERDDRLAILATRLRYFADPKPLPTAGDIPGLASYWKRVYNTRLGAGQVSDFIGKYNRYVLS